MSTSEIPGKTSQIQVVQARPPSVLTSAFCRMTGSAAHRLSKGSCRALELKKPPCHSHKQVSKFLVEDLVTDWTKVAFQGCLVYCLARMGNRARVGINISVLSCCLVAQVIRDFLSKPKEDGELMDTPAERVSLLADLEAWLERPEKTMHKPLPRVCSWKWVAGLDNMLQIMLSTDLSQFAHPGHEWKSPIKISATSPSATAATLLSLCVDQCSSQLSPAYYLMYAKGLNIALLHDPSHRCNNDLLGAVRSSNLWPVLRAKSLSWNVHYGPWNTGAHWAKVIDAAKERAHRLGGDDPILQMLLPRIARARGEECQLANPDYASQISDQIAASVAKKHDKFQCSRWWGCAQKPLNPKQLWQCSGQHFPHNPFFPWANGGTPTPMSSNCFRAFGFFQKKKGQKNEPSHWGFRVEAAHRRLLLRKLSA